MEASYSRRHQPPSPSPSPRLLRSQSGGSAVMPRATSPGMLSSTSQRYTTTNRSKSTAKTRPNIYNYNKANNKEEDKPNTLLLICPSIPSTQKTKPQEKELGFAKFLPRGGLRGFGASKGGGAGKLPVSVGSPSAWALSPGRSLQLAANSAATPDNSRVKSKSSGGGGGGVNGVLKYFRQKKVSPVQEEEFHRFRILYNVLLQWRFANARAEAAIPATNDIAQSKLFSVWLRIFKMRNFIVEKRIQVEKLKWEIKLYEILSPQILLLNEWTKLERRNQESVSKLVTKLSGLSLRLPLIHGAKADVMSVYEAISEAMVAMDGIEAIITRFFTEVEIILYMVTELLITKKQHKENLEELEKSVASIATLVAKETGIRAHCIQAALESVRNQNG